jgi:two-component system, chemotaxis family, protein-glutamate methylesterase/glutaminase
LKTKVLIADNDPSAFEHLKRTLSSQGLEVDEASNALIALEKLKTKNYDILMTDLILPEMDGVKLVERARTEVKQLPLIIIFSHFYDPNITKRFNQLGINDTFEKPIDFKLVFKKVYEKVLAKKADLAGKTATPTPIPSIRKKTLQPPIQPIRPSQSASPFSGVVIAASTGGPQALKKVIANLTLSENWAGFIVQHSPAWALDSMAKRLASEFGLRVMLAKNSMNIEKKTIYVAPGSLHTIIDPKTFCLKLLDTPLENSVRPAADPLFRSAATVFGSNCIGVVLSGLGRDGALGAKAVFENGGKILIQDPSSAVAPFMPKAAKESCLKSQILSIENIGKTIDSLVLRPLNKTIKKALS